MRALYVFVYHHICSEKWSVGREKPFYNAREKTDKSISYRCFDLNTISFFLRGSRRFDIKTMKNDSRFRKVLNGRFRFRDLLLPVSHERVPHSSNYIANVYIKCEQYRNNRRK